MIKKEKINSIEDFFKINAYIQNNQIVVDKKNIYVYRVYPLNFVDENLIEERIFQSYTSFINGIIKKIQIIVKIEELCFNEEILKIKSSEQYKKNNNVNNLVNDYETWLKEYLNKEKIFVKTFYIIIQEKQKSNIKNMIEVLENVGVSVMEIKNKKEICKLIKECIYK